MLDNLKSLFIVPEGDDEKKEGDQKSHENLKDPKERSAISNSEVSSSNRPKANPKIMEKLLSVLDSKNISGFDYIEYKKALQAMSKMPMDEQTRFRSAFATASTMGATLENLVSSISTYKGILSFEKNHFFKEMNAQVGIKINSKEQMVADLEKSIVEKSDMIKKLTAEINESQSQTSELKKKIEEDKLNIERTRFEFSTTYDMLIAQIDYDLAKINEYLK